MTTSLLELLIAAKNSLDNDYGGWSAGGWVDKLKVRLTQHNFSEVGVRDDL